MVTGAHWNREIWTIHCQNDGKDVFTGQRWIVDNNAPLNDQFERRQQVKDAREPTTHMTEPEKILRTRMETAEDFDQLVAKGKPFVMEGLDIGCCTQCWTAEKLIERVDPKRMVSFLLILRLYFFVDYIRLPSIKLRRMI